MVSKERDETDNDSMSCKAQRLFKKAYKFKLNASMNTTVNQRIRFQSFSALFNSTR